MKTLTVNLANFNNYFRIPCLWCVSGEDTKMRFSMKPGPGDTDFEQWQSAMKMVARLPDGVPHEFRNTVIHILHEIVNEITWIQCIIFHLLQLFKNHLHKILFFKLTASALQQSLNKIKIHGWHVITLNSVFSCSYGWRWQKNTCRPGTWIGQKWNDFVSTTQRTRTTKSWACKLSKTCTGPVAVCSAVRPDWKTRRCLNEYCWVSPGGTKLSDIVRDSTCWQHSYYKWWRKTNQTL